VDAVTGNPVGRAKLVPELIVSDLAASLAFWCDLIGFRIAFERPEHRFAYLDFDGAEVMLEQNAVGVRHWITAKLEHPLGRGANFQVSISDIEQPLDRLRKAGWPLFMEPEEKWYRVDEIEAGQRQFLVQDPDGYLIRLAQWTGNRPIS
jgi:catechol 2,3-dioxygenase-like lactoylglutathione lyase family enzyme